MILDAAPEPPQRAPARRRPYPPPAPRPPKYTPHFTLTVRQLHQLMQMESHEALKLARSIGLETP